MTKVKDKKTPVYLFTHSALIQSLKTSTITEEDKNTVLSFLTSKHCYDDLYYYVGDFLNE